MYERKNSIDFSIKESKDLRSNKYCNYIKENTFRFRLILGQN